MKNNYKKSPSFKDYGLLLTTLDPFLKQKNLKGERFHKVCFPKNLDSKDSPDLVRRSLKEVDDYCRLSFLKNITHRKESTKITFKNLDYLKYSLPYYLKGQHRKAFIKYLSKIDESSKLHQLVSELMTEQYLENRFKPNSSHLKFIKISTELTNYVQSAGLRDSSERNYFTKAFYAIKREFDREIKKNNIVINDDESTIHIPVILGTDIKNFDPQIKTVSWANALTTGAKDFSKGAVDYTITSAGQQKTYKVTVKVDNNPVLNGYYADPEIIYAHKTNKYYIYPTSDGFTNWSGTYFKTFSSPV